MDSMNNRSVCKFILFSFCIYHVSAESNVKNQSIFEIETSRENFGIATVTPLVRQSRTYRQSYDRRGNSDYQDDQHDYNNDDMNDMNDHEDDHNHMKAISQPKVDYWAGYYDFLINEGSYKFWAVFQLATAALLIYSGFAALYYAKVNPPTTDDYFDDIFRRRKRRSFPPAARDKPFAGFDAITFQRIIEAAIDTERTYRFHSNSFSNDDEKL